MKNQREGKTITFSERDVSFFIAALIIGLFLVFAAGYFIGKRRVCEELSLRDDVHFSERVKAALSNLRSPLKAEETEDADDPTDASARNVSNSSSENAPTVSDPAAAEQEKSGRMTREQVRKRAVAQLCGFGTSRRAEAYLDRLTKRGVTARLVERSSVGRKGEKRRWYQVVAGPYEQGELQIIVSELQRTDKLSGVTIVPCE
ncbi:MAG: hypothetical protein JW725_00420 [Candidatus Babeliaceae bacterium]|nr:hypothetical protein [Candidatus Babeliaceae bacterium]